MRKKILIDNQRLTLKSFIDYSVAATDDSTDSEVSFSPTTLENAQASHMQLLQLIENNTPLYGVTTGFGDSSQRSLHAHQSEELQKNLINYLSCGTGPYLSEEVCRAILLARLKSLSRGYSGIRPQLLEQMRLYLNNNWIPAIRSEGSLGASGDLVPLAAIAQCLQGQGTVYVQGKLTDVAPLLKQQNQTGIALFAKEGLALVNGTSAMVGAASINYSHIRRLFDLHMVASTWTCLALGGRREAFGPLVNSVAAQHSGQALVAKTISTFLEQQNYQNKPLQTIARVNDLLEQPVQDKYSLRCVPQILGPVQETLALCERWLEDELNSTSDNPLISAEGDLANGGNFYGGYIAHAMDYLKICLVQMADLADRQLIQIMDEKSNRGLPSNLVDWDGLPPSDRHLHHGLKGLHQSASAITSEIAALSLANSIFSRSAESHNQDKVSLGMSAANQCQWMIEKSYTVLTLHLICLAQALDLRGVQLTSAPLRDVYEVIRKHVPFCKKDTALQEPILNLTNHLKTFNLIQGIQNEKL